MISKLKIHKLKDIFYHLSHNCLVHKKTLLNLISKDNLSYIIKSEKWLVELYLFLLMVIPLNLSLILSLEINSIYLSQHQMDSIWKLLILKDIIIRSKYLRKYSSKMIMLKNLWFNWRMRLKVLFWKLIVKYGIIGMIK